VVHERTINRNRDEVNCLDGSRLNAD
jgi:hypothetical protein